MAKIILFLRNSILRILKKIIEKSLFRNRSRLFLYQSARSIFVNHKLPINIFEDKISEF